MTLLSNPPPSEAPARYARRHFWLLLGLGAFLGRPGAGEAERWDDPAWLRAWQAAPRYPVLESSDPLARRFLAAIHRGDSLVIRYLGGSEPGLRRLVTPSALYRVEGFPSFYLTAHCHLRQKPRHFRLDLIEIAA